MEEWAEPALATSLGELREVARGAMGSKDEGHYIYRGQASGWSLATTIERACRDSGIDLAHAPDIDRQLLREFTRRAHHYLHDVPREGHTIEWRALMQHHGAPTRLLDWTYALPIAAYFALVSALPVERDAEVWMIDAAWCRNAAIHQIVGDDWVLLDHLGAASHEARLARLLRSDEIPYAFPVNPFRLNERLTIQRGLFLYHGDLRASFVENLRALDGHRNRENVCRFRIPHENVWAVLTELQEVNVSDATLFPGLDGFSRSLQRRLRFFRGRREL